ncbi:Uncharacterised protein [Chryseobacterium taihuense]|uniref:Uncharacterized protein n=1 Tax=Chryseobacterium taihuense TaxID=1141221 RepID=A0A4V6ID90_9FLAO|nr:Uncharacterised protein [Chryseobacterium taihuense]
MFFYLLSTSVLFSQKISADSINQNKDLRSAVNENNLADKNSVSKSEFLKPTLYVTKGTLVYNAENISNAHIVEVQKKSVKTSHIAKISETKKSKNKEYDKLALKKVIKSNPFTYKAFPIHSHYTSESTLKDVAVISSNSSNHKNASDFATIYTPFITFYAIPESNFEENSFLYYNIISQNNFARPPPLKIS